MLSVGEGLAKPQAWKEDMLRYSLAWSLQVPGVSSLSLHPQIVFLVIDSQHQYFFFAEPQVSNIGGHYCVIPPSSHGTPSRLTAASFSVLSRLKEEDISGFNERLIID